ncbi:MAG: hypothetical protein N3A53_06625, partial [Verrucomicrobiae bacterium]|nr:hypothetical protein [Verrucomicrobiae bacterium]
VYKRQALASGLDVPPYYDSMIGKLICYARDRRTALDRMSRALDEFVIRGIRTTIPLHKMIIKDPNFRRGRYSTSFVERLLNTTTQAGLQLSSDETKSS